jgi:tRNA threonylcarbamoyladenosine biosynthesis protein TsaE
MSGERQVRELISASEVETEAIGERLAQVAERRASADRPFIVLLEGELGAGKTRLVRGLARGLGIDPGQVMSPTFVTSVTHRGRPGGVDLVHIDAWRIRSVGELDSLGWDELLRSGDRVIAIEWPSKIAAALPEEALRLTIEHLGADRPEARRIRIEDRTDSATDADVLGAALGERTADAASRCPVCQAPLGADAATFPFCSGRCRMADLHRWFGGGYRLTRPATADDELGD